MNGLPGTSAVPCLTVRMQPAPVPRSDPPVLVRAPGSPVLLTDWFPQPIRPVHCHHGTLSQDHRAPHSPDEPLCKRGFPAPQPPGSSNRHFPHTAPYREVHHLSDPSRTFLLKSGTVSEFPRFQIRIQVHFLQLQRSFPRSLLLSPLLFSVRSLRIPSPASLKVPGSLRSHSAPGSLSGRSLLPSLRLFSSRRGSHRPPQTPRQGYPECWIRQTPSVFSPRLPSPSSFHPEKDPDRQRHSPHDG